MINKIYCPNSRCRNHMHPPEEIYWMRKKGFITTKRDGRVQRYQCKDCLTTFSLSYFTIDHGVHRRLPYHEMVKYLAGGSGLRATARAMNCSPHMITHRMERLSNRVASVCAKEIIPRDLNAKMKVGISP